MAGTSLPNILASQRISATPPTATPKHNYLQRKSSSAVQPRSTAAQRSEHSTLADTQQKLHIKQCIDAINKLKSEYDTKVDLLSVLQRKCDTAADDLQAVNTTVSTLQSTQPDAAELKQYIQQQFRLTALHKSYQTQRTDTERVLTDLNAKINKSENQLKQLKYQYAMLQTQANEQGAQRDATLNKIVQRRQHQKQQLQHTQSLDAQIEQSLQEIKQQQPQSTAQLAYNERLQRKLRSMKQTQRETELQQQAEYSERVQAVTQLKQSLHTATIDIRHQLAAKQLRRTVRSAHRADERKLLTEQGVNAAAVFAARDEASKLQPALKQIAASKQRNTAAIQQQVAADAAYVAKQQAAEQLHADAVKQYRIATSNNIVDKAMRQSGRKHKRWQLLSEPVLADSADTPNNSMHVTNTATTTTDAVDVQATHTDNCTSNHVDATNDGAVADTAALAATQTLADSTAATQLLHSAQPASGPQSPLRHRPVAKPVTQTIKLPNTEQPTDPLLAHQKSDSTFGEELGSYSQTLRSPPRHSTQHTTLPHTRHTNVLKYSFLASPSSVHFDAYELGGRYAQTVTVTNVSGSMCAMRLNKLQNTLHNSLTVLYESIGQMSSGISNTITIIFQPSKQLCEQADVCSQTELTYIDKNQLLHTIPITCTRKVVAATPEEPKAEAQEEKSNDEELLAETQGHDAELSQTVEMPPADKPAAVPTQSIRAVSAVRRPIPRPVQARVQPVDLSRHFYDDLK